MLPIANCFGEAAEGRGGAAPAALPGPPVTAAAPSVVAAAPAAVLCPLSASVAVRFGFGVFKRCRERACFHLWGEHCCLGGGGGEQRGSACAFGVCRGCAVARDLGRREQGLALGETNFAKLAYAECAT